MVEDLTLIRRGPLYFFRPLRKIFPTLSLSASLESTEENQNVSKASAVTPSASGLQTNESLVTFSPFLHFLAFILAPLAMAM